MDMRCINFAQALNANNIIFTMPRFLSKMQGEFSLKEVGFEVFIKCYGIEI